MKPDEYFNLLRELATTIDIHVEPGYEEAHLLAERARQAAEEIEGRLELEPELVESIARLIYGSMRFDRIDTTANWQESGNSFAQDEARRCARAILARFGGGEVK